MILQTAGYKGLKPRGCNRISLVSCHAFVLRKLVSPMTQKAIAGGSSSSWQGRHSNQTGVRVGTWQSITQTLPLRTMTGDGQRLRKQIRKKCVLKMDTLAQGGKWRGSAKIYGTTQLVTNLNQLWYSNHATDNRTERFISNHAEDNRT